LRSRPRDYEESRRRMGITLERAYVQHTPMGDYTVVYFESQGDIAESFAKAAKSDLEVDRWMLKAVKEIHGADLTQPLPGKPPETVRPWVDTNVTERRRGLALCAPLRPGVVEKARAFLDDAYSRPEYAESRRSLDVNAELVTINYTPHGEVAGIYIEGKDPVQANRGFAASTKPFDVWFKEQLRGIFPDEVDFSRPVEPTEEILDSAKFADLSDVDLVGDFPGTAHLHGGDSASPVAS
jgi:hypothetical protein